MRNYSAPQILGKILFSQTKEPVFNESKSLNTGSCFYYETPCGDGTGKPSRRFLLYFSEQRSQLRITHYELRIKLRIGLVVFLHSRNKAAKSDLCRTEVVYFIDLELGVELSAAFEDPSYLVRCDSVDAAAE